MCCSPVPGCKWMCVLVLASLLVAAVYAVQWSQHRCLKIHSRTIVGRCKGVDGARTAPAPSPSPSSTLSPKQQEMGKCEGRTTRDGSWYWVREADRNAGDAELVVLLAWLRSKRQHLVPYVHMFNEFGYECLVCCPSLLNWWVPSRAFALAVSILDELAEELHKRPRRVFFASFSEGTKACSYMIIQILRGDCKGFACDMGKYEIVRRCVSGFMFDSTPVNFVGDKSHRLYKRMLGPVSENIAVDFTLRTAAKALDSLLPSERAEQEAEMRGALVSAVKMAPVLFLCAKNDEFVPFESVLEFYSQVKDLGGVTLLSWDDSVHVAHLRYHPDEYRQAVSKFLREEFKVSSWLEDKDAMKSGEQVAALQDVAHMIAEDVYDLQHDCKNGLLNKNVLLTFTPMRSRL